MVTEAWLSMPVQKLEKSGGVKHRKRKEKAKRRKEWERESARDIEKLLQSKVLPLSFILSFLVSFISKATSGYGCRHFRSLVCLELAQFCYVSFYGRSPSDLLISLLLLLVPFPYHPFFLYFLIFGSFLFCLHCSCDSAFSRLASIISGEGGRERRGWQTIRSRASSREPEILAKRMSEEKWETKRVKKEKEGEKNWDEKKKIRQKKFHFSDAQSVFLDSDWMLKSFVQKRHSREIKKGFREGGEGAESFHFEP